MNRKIAVPRPLKRSLIPATSVAPVLDLEYPDSDDCFALRDHDAERELQEILCNGLCSSFNLESSPAFEPPELPFFNFSQDEGFAFDFPQLGMSPVPPNVQESSLPGRARNPITMNSPFGIQKEIIAQAILPIANQLELLTFSDEASMRMRRSRSYSEPLPFVYATGETSAN